MRHTLSQEIAAIAPHDALEAEHIAETLAWIGSGAPLWRVAKPATPPRHLVAYFVLVDDGHVLLVDHKNACLWLPTGGHVDVDENPRQTVVRELREELGCAPNHAIGAPLFLTCTETVGLTAGHVDVSLWYVLHASRQQQFEWDDDEFNAVRWFAFDDVPLARSDAHMQRFIAKLQATTTPLDNPVSALV